MAGLKHEEVAQLLGRIANDIIKIAQDEKEAYENGYTMRAFVTHELMGSANAIGEYVEAQSDKFADTYNEQLTNIE